MALFYSAVNIISDVEIHVGDTAAIQKMRERGSSVTTLQADGDELETIQNEFSGIRMHSGRVVEWLGDDAKFIAMHFPKR